MLAVIVVNMRNKILNVEWRGLTSKVFFISVASSIVYGPEELIHSKLIMTLSVLYGTQTLLLCSIHSQINPVHTSPPSHFFKIHVNVLIFHLCLGLPIYFFRLPHQNPVCLSLLLFFTVPLSISSYLTLSC